MKLNVDCVRDILLYLEDKIDTINDCVDFDELCSEFANKYDRNTLHYHINQISKSKLVDSVFYCDDEPELINDLSPAGHEFIANIRSNTVWNKTKDISKNIGCTSLNAFKDIASNVITELITSQFK